jgi:serralysin
VALLIIGTDKVGSGIQVQLGSQHDATILAGIVVGSTDINAIVGSGSGHSVNVDGTVVSPGSAIDIGANGTSNGQQLNIAVDGYVGSSSSLSAAVVIRGHSSSVGNLGILHGDEYGLSLFGDGAAHTTTVNNSGLIEGDTYAVYRYAAASAEQTIVLNNSGEVRSEKFAYFGTDEAGVDKVNNSGLIVGDVLLGGGSDVYSGAAGRIDGTVSGGAGADSLTGGAFADIFSGGADVDTLQGGGGSDQLAGDAGSDTIGGGAGGDLLNGGVGADTMNGGADNDTYIVDDQGDRIIDSGGVDQVVSSVSFDFSDPLDAQGTSEKLTLVGGGNINAGGNAVANTLIGNGGSNVMSGKAGNDAISGNDGNDKLAGDAGNDVLNGGIGLDELRGGLGNDVMTGGTLADKFIFDTAASTTLNRDFITDFQAGLDKMVLDNAVFAALGGVGGLKGAFFFQGSAAHDDDDHIVYNKATGGLSYDADGTGAQAAIQFAVLKNTPVLNAADFQVI